MTDVAVRHDTGQDSLIEEVVIQGNLSNLTPQQRAAYYSKVCSSLGLNPYTRPFEYLTLQQGKLTLYARKDATDQLRSLRRVSLTITARETVGDLYVVTARATLPDGRTDEEIGAVPVKGLGGEALANAYMKCSTKAKRRVTLSICGLGMLDETEVDSIPGARVHAEEPRERPPLGAYRATSGDWVPVTPPPTPEPDQPPLLDAPEEAISDLWEEVKALAAQLEAAGVRFMLPPPTQSSDFHRQWIVRMTRALRANGG